MLSSVLLRMRMLILIIACPLLVVSQNSIKPRYANSVVYTGIEVGSKGVKMSVIEIGKNAKSSGAFQILKDSSVNTDFISFTPATFSATLDGFCGLYNTALKTYDIPANRIFTVISSGVKMQAEKDEKIANVIRLIDSFRIKINEPNREVELVDVDKEAKLSHLGIIPENRRFNTFLFDIGSGNTKGGFFPGNDTKTFHLFQLNWGTRSVLNMADKRCTECTNDPKLLQYNKYLQRVLAGAENTDIAYQVNSSGAYPLSDNIAVSGGIAWAVATLLHPELIENSIVSVSLDEIRRFCETIYTNPDVFQAKFLAGNINRTAEKEMVTNEVSRVHKVFDQKSLMAGAGLMYKIMRQFQSVFETKQFYLVKNGQVGWVSAYVDQTIKQ